MYTRNKALIVFAILLLVGGYCHNVFASTIRTYCGSFDLPIPAEPGSTKGFMDNAVIEVPDHFSILDIDVAVNITHTSVWDLQLFLRSPIGTECCLNMYNIDEKFTGENYTGTIFDDEAEISIEEGTAPFTGRFRSRGLDGSYKLQSVYGQDTYGTWQLRIYDAFYDHTGTLDSCELIITVPEPATVIFLTLGQGLAILLRPRRR